MLGLWLGDTFSHYGGAVPWIEARRLPSGSWAAFLLLWVVYIHFLQRDCFINSNDSLKQPMSLTHHSFHLWKDSTCYLVKNNLLLPVQLSTWIDYCSNCVGPSYYEPSPKLKFFHTFTYSSTLKNGEPSNGGLWGIQTFSEHNFTPATACSLNIVAGLATLWVLISPPVLTPVPLPITR